MSVFGPLWHPGILEDAVLKTLGTWLPVYLTEVCRQETVRTGKTKTLAEPNSWAVASEYERWPETNLPAIIVAAPGMTTDPTRSGNGDVKGDWQFEVSATITADTAKNTRRNAQLYLAAIIGAILQRRSLGKTMVATALTAVDYVDVPNEKRRSIVSCAAAFTAQVDPMVSTNQGPTVPDPIPADWPAVSETNIETEIA